MIAHYLDLEDLAALVVTCSILYCYLILLLSIQCEVPDLISNLQSIRQVQSGQHKDCYRYSAVLLMMLGQALE